MFGGGSTFNFTPTSSVAGNVASVSPQVAQAQPQHQQQLSNQPGQPQSTLQISQAPAPTTTTGAGLGGIPAGNAGPRISSLALGTDPGTGWSTRNDNRAVQDLPVPQEIMQAVEELKAQMEKHKVVMGEVNRASDLDIDMVAEQIEEVRQNLTNLGSLMHKQELQSATLIKDMQELSKDMDLLAKTKDAPNYGYGGTSAMLYNFLYDLIQKYSDRMVKYKAEIERAEFSLQTLMGTYNINAKDLWASLTAIKDTVIMLAAQIQQLHEDIRNELGVHKNISQVLYATSPKPWLASAISGSSDVGKIAPPLERVLSTPNTKATAAGGGGGPPSLETMYQRTYSMLNRVPATTELRSHTAPSSESILRSPQYGTAGGTMSASMYGSYVGPSSPAAAASLKRSKK